MDITKYLPLLVPVVGAMLGAIGIVTRDLYDRRTEVGRRTFAMDIATRQVNFAADWWKAKQALGCAPDDQSARAIAESWLDEATSLVTETQRPPPTPQPEPSVTRKILLAYPFHRLTARILRVVYYILLVFVVFSALMLLTPILVPDMTFGDAIATVITNVVFYGLLALGVRACAVSLEKPAAKQRTPSTSAPWALPTGGLTAPQPGWYPDPSGVLGRRYWDGHRWTAVSRGST